MRKRSHLLNSCFLYSLRKIPNSLSPQKEMHGTLSDSSNNRLQRSAPATSVGGNLQPMNVADEFGHWKGQASFKSWAKQTEESYQLQQALALRLSSQAACADDPNFLDLESSSSSNSAEAVSHRFWVCQRNIFNLCLNSSTWENGSRSLFLRIEWKLVIGILFLSFLFCILDHRWTVQH